MVTLSAARGAERNAIRVGGVVVVVATVVVDIAEVGRTGSQRGTQPPIRCGATDVSRI